MSNLQQQVQSLHARKREEWENLAILAISAAFKNTPINQHEELLNNIYTQIIRRVFAATDEVRERP